MGGRDRETEDDRRVAAAIEYLDHHVRDQPSLADVADAVGLSPRLHDLFVTLDGVTPGESATGESARSR